jgi:hypothetical protein
MSRATSIDWPAFSTLDRLVNRLRVEVVEVRVWLHDDAASGLAAMNDRSGIQIPGAVSPVSASSAGSASRPSQSFRGSEAQPDSRHVRPSVAVAAQMSAAGGKSSIRVSSPRPMAW